MTERLLPVLAPALALGAALLAPSVAMAAPYEVFVDVDDEEEIYDLQVAGDIGTGTFEILVDLIRRGVDLNTASREQLYALPNLSYEDVDAILAYREEAGRIGSPAALVLAGAITQRKLASVAAFLLVPAPEGSKAGVRGEVRYKTVWTSQDDRAPPMLLQARVSMLRHLTVGAAAVLDRNRLQNAVWDPNRDAFTSDGPRTTARVPKYFAQWDTPKWGVIGGTYNIGFGQKLVFDTTGRYTPNGFTFDDTMTRRTALTTRCRLSAGELEDTPCPQEDQTYVTPDYREQIRLRGVAVGAKHIDMPVGWLQAYGFFSHQTKQIYSAGLYNTDACSDPRLSSELFEECRAPSVYQTPGTNPLAPTPKILYATLPNMYNEVLGGTNVSYFIDRRTHVGVTGYGSGVTWLVDGTNVDFQEWQRTPYGGPFGAAGADMSWGRKWADVFAEVAYSFDSIQNDGGGGPAAIVRNTATWSTHEIEVSGRYYDEKYRNPYARPLAASDQSDGLRASDEAGGRLRYTGFIGERTQLRTYLDIWQDLSADTTRLQTYARGDVQVTPWLRPGLWLDFRSNDVAGRGRDRCYSGEDEGITGLAATTDFQSYEDFLAGDDLGCSGVRYQLRPRIRVDPHKRVNAQLQFQYSWVDRGRYENRFSHDARVVGIVGVNPIDPLRLRLRITWDKDEVSDDTFREETLWGYFQASYRFQTWLQPSLRYDIRAWLDDRVSTSFRRPNPEHWVLLQILSRF